MVFKGGLILGGIERGRLEGIYLYYDLFFVFLSSCMIVNIE